MDYGIPDVLFVFVCFVSLLLLLFLFAKCMMKSKGIKLDYLLSVALMLRISLNTFLKYILLLSVRVCVLFCLPFLFPHFK